MGKSWRIDWNVQIGQDVRQRPDVILVPVSDQDAPDAVGSFDEVRDVRDDEVNPRHVFCGELDAAVDDYDVFAAPKIIMFFPISPRPPSGITRRGGVPETGSEVKLDT